MPSNQIKVNNSEDITWEVPDSKMEDLISNLNTIGTYTGKEGALDVKPDIDIPGGVSSKSVVTGGVNHKKEARMLGIVQAAIVLVDNIQPGHAIAENDLNRVQTLLGMFEKSLIHTADFRE